MKLLAYSNIFLTVGWCIGAFAISDHWDDRGPSRLAGFLVGLAIFDLLVLGVMIVRDMRRDRQDR